MGALLESGKVGNVHAGHLKTIREDVINRWDNLGLLEGLNGYQKENIAQLFENEASYLINESTALGAEGSFETVVFPIVRRVFSKLLANEIVSVQSLNLPIGKLYYFIPKIGSSAFDAAGVNQMTGSFGGKNLYDAFYGEDGLFDNSKSPNFELVDGTVEGTTFVYANSGYTATAVTTITANASGIVKVDFGANVYQMIGGYDAAEEFVSTLKLVVGETVLDHNFAIQKYGDALMSTDGVVYVVVNNTTGADVDLADVTAVAKSYASLEMADEMGEVSFELKSVTVSVIERKLRVQWSPELAQDVNAFHNIDAEAELTALLSEQVAAEIDREILRDLRRGAAWRLYWDYKGGAGASSVGVDPSNGYYTQKDWNQTLITAINQVSAQIHKATLRGGANWIVCSAEVSAIFDDLEYFHVSNAAPEQDKFNMGIERVGSLSGRYQVYRDPYFPADTILIGHKGNSLLDTGYIYAPYVPLQLTPTMYNPFTFAPVKGVMTRYAKKMVNNRFYGVVKVKNVVTFGLDGLR